MFKTWETRPQPVCLILTSIKWIKCLYVNLLTCLAWDSSPYWHYLCLISECSGAGEGGWRDSSGSWEHTEEGEARWRSGVSVTVTKFSGVCVCVCVCVCVRFPRPLLTHYSLINSCPSDIN